jgi:uncharacterized protein YceK
MLHIAEKRGSFRAYAMSLKVSHENAWQALRSEARKKARTHTVGIMGPGWQAELNRKVIIILVCVALCGCGTIITQSNSDKEIAAKLRKQKSNCESLPRIYSGVSYDFCELHAKNDSIEEKGVLEFQLLDIASSAIMDTIFLPYSIYAQEKYGNIKIK